MNNHKKRRKSTAIPFVIFFLITFMFFLNVFSVQADEQLNIVIPSDQFYSADNFSLITNITDLFTIFQTTVDITNVALPYIGYNVTHAVELPSNVSVIELPNNRIVLESSDRSFLFSGSIIESGMNFTIFHDNYAVVGVPELGSLIGVSTPIINSSMIVTDATFVQSIDFLDEYKVKVVFPNLYTTRIARYISSYSIDWGDGSGITTYAPAQITPSHIYTSSGTYTQKYYITSISDQNIGYNRTDLLYALNYSVNNEGVLLHTFFVVKANPAPVAATSIGTITLLGFALTETGKYKLLTSLALLFPMFTRIQKDDVLDQFVRGEIYGFIKTKPGVCYNEIMKKLDMRNGTLSHHLHMLEKTEMIKSRREGIRYRAFYPAEIKFPQEERYRLSDFQLKILKIVKEDEGIQQKDIAKKLGKKPQTINYNIKILQQAGLIKVRKKGRETGCYILKESSDNQNEIP